MASTSPAPAKAEVTKKVENLFNSHKHLHGQESWGKEPSSLGLLLSTPRGQCGILKQTRGEDAPTGLVSGIDNNLCKCFTSPGPGGETSTCSTWEKSTVVHWQIKRSGIESKFHLQRLSLAIDNCCPAGYWSKGSQSTPSKVWTKGFLVGKFWFEILGGGREKGQAAKSPHAVCVVVLSEEDGEVHNDPIPLSGRPPRNLTQKCCQTKFIEITR